MSRRLFPSLRSATPSLLVFFTLVPMLSASPSMAAVVGYYEMCEGQGNTSQVAPITAAGHTPVQLTTLSAAELATVDVAFVNNCSNGGYGSEYLARLADIQASVNAGLVLVLHDRYVDAAETILPGGAGFDVRRNFADPANVQVLDATTLVTNGPGGVVTNTTLDGGNYSSHGYAVSGSLPAGAARILTTGAAANILTFAYRFGAGSVVYSSIPLDFYLWGGKAEFRTIYAPNVIAYAAGLNSCGNGVVSGAEQCDDGNQVDGDCCSAACEFETAGSACASDGNSCTNDVCDGAGTCTNAPNALACNDGNTCTTGDTCGAGVCQPGALVVACINGDGCCIPGCTATTDSDCPALDILEYQSTIVDDSIDPINGLPGLYQPLDMAFSGDGAFLYVVSYVDRTVTVFERDPGTGALTWVEADPAAMNALVNVNSVVISPDDQHVYTANEGGSYTGVSLFTRDETTGEVTWVARYQAAGLTDIKQIVISPDGRNIYAASGLDMLVAWERNPATGVLTHTQTFLDGTGGVDGLDQAWEIDISPDGRHVYVASFAGHEMALFTRDTDTGLLSFTTSMHDNTPGFAYLKRATSAEVSHDGEIVYGGAFDEDLSVYQRDADTGLLTFQKQYPQAGGPQKAVVSPDDGRLYMTAWSAALNVFGRDLVSNQVSFLETELDGVDGVDGMNGMQGIAVSPDGLDVYVGSFYDRAIVHFRVRCGDGSLDAGEACDDGNGAGGDGCSSSCTVEFCWNCTAAPFATSVCTPDEGKPCDDGLFCTGSSGDTCQAGVCTGPARTCDDANACTLDSCDENANLCAHDGPILDGLPCDDGAWCTVGDFCMAAACVPGGSRDCGDGQDCTVDACNEASDACTNTAKADGTACESGATCVSGETCSSGVCGSGTPDATTCLDHYLCYKSSTTKGTTPFETVPALELTDVVESVATDVSKPSQLCAPAGDVLDGLLDGVAQLEGYRIQATKGEPKHEPVTGIGVSDPWGSIVVDTLKPRGLLVPTSRALGEPAGDLPTTSKVDAFKCYGVKLGAASPPLASGRQVTLADTLSGNTVIYDVGKPRTLCVPVDAAGAGIHEPLGHLMCYRAKPAKGEAKPEPIENQIHTSNEFGDGRVDTKKPDVVCVPATATWAP